jgi:hypothetical protein
MIKKSTTVRMLVMMLQAVCLFLVFSSVSNASYTPINFGGGGGSGYGATTGPFQECLSTCHKPAPLSPDWDKYRKCRLACIKKFGKLNQAQAVTIVQYALIPIQFIITYVAYIMGFFFMAWGLYRLRHGHEGGGFNQKHSGAGTALCFVAATMIFQYQWSTKMIGNSMLGHGSDQTTGWDTSSGTLPLDPENLFGYVQGTNSALQSSAVQVNSSSGILQNWHDLHPGSRSAESFWTLETLFAVLMVVGYISFLRGALLLVKMGEGSGGGESSGTKAVVHIVAAGLLCNANHMTSLISNLSDQVNVAGGGG